MAINENEVDIIIGATKADLTTFMNKWKPIFSCFHLVIVKAPELKEELSIPEGFNADIYDKSDMEKVAGLSSETLFLGSSCKYFGFLVSKKKYIISIDEDSIPAKDTKGDTIDPVAQHITNLATPATPFFFNTLYDPYRNGADFVRGYPFSMRSGVPCALSCGLWSNTEAAYPRYVDAVLTIPSKVMSPMSGHNFAFDKVLGAAMIPSFKLKLDGVKWETMEDLWRGMCAKAVADHLGVGVKSGLPYVCLKGKGEAEDALKDDPEGVKLMEEVIPFFEGLKLPVTAVDAEDCVEEIAKAALQRLVKSHAAFGGAAEAMMDWAALWRRYAS